MVNATLKQRRSVVGWLIPTLIVVLAIAFFGPFGSFAVGIALVIWSFKLARPERFVVGAVGAILAVWPIIVLADDLLGTTVIKVS